MYIYKLSEFRETKIGSKRNEENWDKILSELLKIQRNQDSYW